MTIRASVVISTYNRASALPPTLEALARQRIAHGEYEVVVVDDGSTDSTPDVLAAADVPYALRTIRLEVNRGVSAGRNAGLRGIRGDVVILLSDDLIVDERFIETHIAMLERFPDSWVVGGFSQLPDLEATPFGRYLARLERGFDSLRIGPPVAPHVWEMTWPTARNLSMPRSDLERIGLFDERFRVTCEDQDLAQRAKAVGIRFLYCDEISCIHNDHAADLERYCRFQERGSADTVRLVMKYPADHGRTPMAQANGPITAVDPLKLRVKKSVKALLATPHRLAALSALIGLAERARLPDRILFRAYTAAIAVATFRGWRTGLAEEDAWHDIGR
jgi:GT2 family glycosyltransferase